MAALNWLPEVHTVVGLLFLVASAVLAIWAAVLYRLKHDLPRAFWHALRVPTALLAVQIVLGIVMLTLGAHPGDPLHFMYAGLVTVGIAAQELLRPRGSLGRILREEGKFNEAGAYAILGTVIALLTIRLWMTGPPH